VGGEERTSTFLFADLAGFTALTEAHGDRQAAELAGEFGQLVRRLLPDEGANEIKTIGDAVMLRFDDARAAVKLGLDVVEAAIGRGEFPVVRVGMHTGTAVERDGDWFGATVNLAARIAGIAAGNEVLLSDATRSAAGELGDIELHSHGVHRMKNVRGSTSIYRALREGAYAEDAVIDPVCRMAIARDDAAGRLIHEGREYFFCSLDCASAFAAAPEEYVSASNEPG
jgi:adenylate cyclase